MKISKAKAIELLRQQLTEVPALKRMRRDHADVGKWREKTRTIIANLFGDASPQLARFDGIRYGLVAYFTDTPDSVWQEAYVEGMENAEAQLEAMLSAVEFFWTDDITKNRPAAREQLALLFDRFHNVARQLKSRYGVSVRPTPFFPPELLASCLQTMRGGSNVRRG